MVWLVLVTITMVLGAVMWKKSPKVSQVKRLISITEGMKPSKTFREAKMGGVFLGMMVVFPSYIILGFILGMWITAIVLPNFVK